MTRQSEHGYDDYLVVMRSTRPSECHKRGSVSCCYTNGICVY